ncbi:hypothetical protein Fmac_024898 [Flemingia macrophylla]|uniref:DNA mismatch repair protein MutS core domain-containing protein n=1 Tax=Flemingia macrophylla TaxID=520843 RepID=A0ABD1LQQ2_9FABA
MTNIQISVLIRRNLESMSILRLILQTSITSHHSSRGQTLDREDDFQLLAVSVQEMMPLSLEEFITWLQIYLLKLESARNDAIVIRGVHDVATDTSVETRKVEGKLDALVNFVTQLACMSILRLMLQTSIAGHHNGRGQTLDREYGFQLLAFSVKEMMSLPFEEFTTFSARNDAIVIRGVHDVATDTYAKTRKVEGKLDALVNLTQLAGNRSLPLLQESVASVLPMTTIQMFATTAGEARILIRRWLRTPSHFSARNDANVIKRVHDVATDTSAETRKVEGKLDALVNLVTQLAVNQKPASVATTAAEARHLIEKVASQSYFGERNDVIVIRGVHNVVTDTSAETRKVEGKLDALVNLVTQLAVNQKSASIARVCGIRPSNDHHTNVCPSSYRGVQDVATDTSAETIKVEGKIDALVNLVTQLAVNQKPASVAIATTKSRGQTLDREDGFQLLAVSLAVNENPASVAKIWGIRSSNDHHTNVCPSKQPRVNEHPEAYTVNIYSRPPQQQRPDT